MKTIWFVEIEVSLVELQQNCGQTSPVAMGGISWAEPPQTEIQSLHIEIWNTVN